MRLSKGPTRCMVPVRGFHINPGELWRCPGHYLAGSYHGVFPAWSAIFAVLRMILVYLVRWYGLGIYV